MCPSRPLRPCGQSGCATLVTSGYCEAHKREQRARVDDRRGSSTKRGYGSKWQGARAAYLRKHPWCVDCGKEGRMTAATNVDHIVPHKGDRAKFWDSANNWQSLCAHHHAVKTAKSDGGFGNRSNNGARSA